MSYDSLLINCCTVLADTGVVPDGYGGIIPDWTNVEGQIDIPCRLVASGGREVMVGAEVVVADYKLFLKNITISEQNRVDIYDNDTMLWGTIYEILLVEIKQDSAISHHKECFLRTVR